jgi:hypothetical protein
LQYSTLITIQSEIAFLYSAAAPIVSLFDNFSIGPNVALLSPLNKITGLKSLVQRFSGLFPTNSRLRYQW